MTIQDRLNQIAELVGGKAWGLDRGMPRIYLKSRRDIKLFLSFEDAVYTNSGAECDDVIVGLFGATLRCYINDCSQGPKWYASQRQIAMESARPAVNAVMWLHHTGNLEEATRILEEEISISDEAALHLINGRDEEARAAVGL